jgi:rhodanese-related sulfurtransferase
MPIDIQRDEVQQLVAAGAQLVEVLPAEEYAQEHLPGAISLPLETFSRASVAALLDSKRIIIVYCQDVA